MRTETESGQERRGVVFSLMSRLLAIWLTLLAAFWLTRAGASAIFFGTADRSYEGIVQLVIVPVIQAVLVAWLTRRSGPFSPAIAVRASWRQADLRAILLFDFVVLALGWILGTLGELGWFSLAGGRNLPSAWMALKAGAAGVVLAIDLRKTREGDRERRLLFAFAAALLALGLSVLLDVLRPLPELLLPSQPRLLRWLVVHGILFAAGTALVLEVQRLLRQVRAAALALDWALGLSLLGALIAVVHLVRRPYLTEPWGSLAATCSSLAVTALLASVLLGRRRFPF